jgi:hypothetical protein
MYVPVLTQGPYFNDSRGLRSRAGPLRPRTMIASWRLPRLPAARPTCTHKIIGLNPDLWGRP